MKICITCKELLPKSLGTKPRKYCDSLCRGRATSSTLKAIATKAAAAERRKQARASAPLRQKLCNFCGETFEYKRGDTKFCKPLCSSRNFNALRKADGRLKAQRQNQRESRKAWFENAKEQRECPCGRKFRVYLYSNTKHCTSLCGNQMRVGLCNLPADHPVMIGIRQKFKQERIAMIEARVRECEANRPPRVWTMGQCKRCGESFIAEWLTSPSLSHQPQFCSSRCGARASKDRRNAVKRGAFVANVYRFKIFERDNWICQLCFSPIDRTAKAPQPLSVSLDHILALANGGTHEPSNTQTAHFICNSLKGDRVDFSFVA